MSKSFIKMAVLSISLGVLAAPTVHAEADKKTERLWKAKCASCHGADGKGSTDQGTKMGVGDYSQAAWQKSQTDAQIKQAILEGVHTSKDGKKQEMEGYKDFSPEQLDSLVKFVRTLGK